MDLPSETECRFRSGGARPPDGAETCDRSKVHSPASHRVSLRTTRRSIASRGAHGPKLVHANSPAHRATGESPVTCSLLVSGTPTLPASPQRTAIRHALDDLTDRHLLPADAERIAGEQLEQLEKQRDSSVTAWCRRAVAEYITPAPDPVVAGIESFRPKDTCRRSAFGVRPRPPVQEAAPASRYRQTPAAPPDGVPADRDQFQRHFPCLNYSGPGTGGLAYSTVANSPWKPPCS